MSLSIIIPVYNEIKQLKVTIKQFPKLKKYFKNFEIVFVDDFSSDGTLNYLRKISKKFRYINVIKNKKKGLGSAIQHGILKCKFKLLDAKTKPYSRTSLTDKAFVTGGKELFMKHATQENVHPQTFVYGEKRI